MSAQENTMLRDAVRGLLQQRMKQPASQAGDEASGWRTLSSDMGLGDVELSTAQAAIVMEEVGRARMIGPFAESLLAAWLLGRCGGDAARKLAASVRSGQQLAALAWAEPTMRYAIDDISLTARRVGENWQLSGMKAVVGWGPAADVLIVAARTIGSGMGNDGAEGDGLSLFLVGKDAENGPTVHGYHSIDGQPAADLHFGNCTIGAAALIGPLGGAAALLEEARDRGMALLAAEAVGLLDVMLEQTLAYTGQRRQFGQAIAEFQALQHRMVDMYLHCELARSSAWLAVEALDQQPAARARSLSCAMVNIAEAGRFVAEQAIQLHGGMGMTDDLPIGHYAKRLMAIEAEWADTHWHLARISQDIG